MKRSKDKRKENRCFKEEKKTIDVTMLVKNDEEDEEDEEEASTACNFVLIFLYFTDNMQARIN